MKSMRTAFVKVANVPSGSAADRLTPRQKTLRMLLRFLKPHIKHKEGLCNLPKPTSTRYEEEVNHYNNLNSNIKSNYPRVLSQNVPCGGDWTISWLT